MVETTTLAVGGAALAVLLVLVVVLLRLRGGDGKYDDAEAQAAHERAQERDAAEAAPVGTETTAVVLELVDGGETARVSVNGLYTFVHDVPGDVGENDTVRLKVTNHSPDGNAAQATYLGRA